MKNQLQINGDPILLSGRKLMHSWSAGGDGLLASYMVRYHWNPLIVL